MAALSEARTGAPAKRLEYTFAVCYKAAHDPFGSLAADYDVGGCVGGSQ